MNQEIVRCATPREQMYRDIIRGLVIQAGSVLIRKENRLSGYAIADLHNAFLWAVRLGIAKTTDQISFQIDMRRIDRFWRAPVKEAVPVPDEVDPREKWRQDVREEEQKREAVFVAVCEYFKVAREELCGESRTRALVYQRAILMYLLLEHTDETQSRVGFYVGKRSQPTVSQAYERVKWNLLWNSTEAQQHVREIRQKFCV